MESHCSKKQYLKILSVLKEKLLENIDVKKSYQANTFKPWHVIFNNVAF